MNLQLFKGKGNFINENNSAQNAMFYTLILCYNLEVWRQIFLVSIIQMKNIFLNRTWT